LAVEECVTPNADFPTYPYLASADFAGGRMTRRSRGCCVPNPISALWRSRVWVLGTKGLPVGLHRLQGRTYEIGSCNEAFLSLYCCSVLHGLCFFSDLLRPNGMTNEKL
jgi:hypothetical protein